MLVLVDVAVVVAWSIGIGAWAPRWPDAWLESDPFPLRRGPGESVARYRRMGVSRVSRRLPELGATFGGESKSQLPGTGVHDLTRYLREVRRAEWVHWASIAGTLVLFLFNPWWLAAAFVLVVAVGNAPFILVLRNNRLRIQGIIEKGGRRT